MATEKKLYSESVQVLLKKLAAEKDQVAKRNIRRALRVKGHKGGLNHKAGGRGKKATAQPKAKPAKKSKSENRAIGHQEQEAAKAHKVISQADYEAAGG